MKDMETQETHTAYCRITGVPSEKTNCQYMVQIQLLGGRDREQGKFGGLGTSGNPQTLQWHVPVTHPCHDPLDTQQTGTLESNMGSGW